jgi:hypothetical protein
LDTVDPKHAWNGLQHKATMRGVGVCFIYLEPKSVRNEDAKSAVLTANIETAQKTF